MLAQLAAVLAQFPDLPNPGNGSDTLNRLLHIFLILMPLGFVFGIVGHLTKTRTLVMIGALLVFAGTAIFLAAVAQNG